MLTKKLVGEITEFEKKVFLSLPIVVISAMVVYGMNSGWAALVEESFIYLILGIAAFIGYFLVKKATIILGQFNLSLMGHKAFEDVPTKTLVMRNRITMYTAVIGAVAAFVWGIYQSADLVMIFSWSLLGIAFGSQQLVEEVYELEETKKRKNPRMY